MTPENFCYWLNGFLELNEKKNQPKDIEITSEQTAVIKSHLALVFNKVTCTPTKSWENVYFDLEEINRPEEVIFTGSKHIWRERKLCSKKDDKSWDLGETPNMLKNTELIGEDKGTVNQIRPHINKWAWDLWLKGCQNNWMPQEIGMQKDIQQWTTDVLSEDEKLVVKRCLGFFAGSESLVSNNLLKVISRYVIDSECLQYIGRQQFEETLHNATIVYICDSLGLDEQELYEAYSRIPSIKAKDDFLMEITRNINRRDFEINSFEGKQELLRNLITYYVVCEGIFFYSGFAMLLALGRQNKLPGVAEQVNLTIRDESLHLQFGTRLISEIIEKYPELWTLEFQHETSLHIIKATELEIAYAKDILPNGILGLNSDMFVQYMKYIGNRRLSAIGLKLIFDEDIKNPFTWMSETIDLRKQKNFFETRVVDYAVGNLKDDL